MGVYCGTCANRISSAPDNYGSFQTTGEDFGGWDKDTRGRSKISDTCERCAEILSAAVVKAARSIARKNQKRIEGLKADIAGSEERQKKREKARTEFENEWTERRRKLGL